MKIVLDLQGAQSHSRHRGIGRYSLSMAKAFAEIAGRHEVWLALNGLHAEAAASLIAEFEGVVPRERIAISVLPRNISGCDQGNGSRIALASMAYDAFLAGLKPDYVWHSSLFEGWGDNSITTLGGGIDDGQHIATLYDLIPLLNPQRYLEDPHYAQWYYQRLGLLKRCGLLLAISESSRQEAIRHLQIDPAKIVVVSGAPDAVFKPIAPNDARRARWKTDWNLDPGFVLYVGGYDAHKNVDGLIAGYSDLPDNVRRCHALVLAGRCETTEMKRLKALARRYRLAESSLIFTGSLADEDIVGLYSSCALFVAPSLHEGLGLPPLEAMACGAAVIGSNSTSLAEVIGYAPALFDPSSRSSIASKLLQALTDASLLERLRERALAQAARFDWTLSANRALEAIERQSAHVRSGRSARPRLLYVSPLPPVRSGIADYSASLLRELASYYAIELVVDQPDVMDAWALGNFPILSVSQFLTHVDNNTRVLYHMGNSPYHAYMFDMLRQQPGIVMMHDFWLSAARNWMANEEVRPDKFLRLLYLSHGYAALMHDRRLGRSSTLDVYPVNLDVLQSAEGLIAHSSHAVAQARRHYGTAVADKFNIVPFPKALMSGNRERSRRLLGLRSSDFVVCSFGMLAPTKLNQRLLDAWLQSSLASNSCCYLFFVGENDGGEYGRRLSNIIAGEKWGARVKITGFVDSDRYSDFLAASDVAVQLRTASRGETSAAIYDVLGMGIPLIVNAHGSAAELPDDVATCLPDIFNDADLVESLQRLQADESLRIFRGEQSRRWIVEQHLPAMAARRYRDVIEGVFADASIAGERNLLTRAVQPGATALHTACDRSSWHTIAAENRARLGCPSVYVDVTAIENSHLHTGIERVVRGVLLELMKLDQSAYRIEPVRLAGGRYRTATRYTLKLLSLPEIDLDEMEVVPRADDIFLGLDWVADLLPANAPLLDEWRMRGVRMFFVVYDLLPVLMPEAFPPVIAPMHKAWLQSIGRHADGLLCISRCVADSVRDWFDQHPPQRRGNMALGYFYPGADLVATQPSSGLPEKASAQLRAMQKTPTFVMVGTVEPRKGHALVLDAFERLWSEGVDADLVIVGRHGWMSDSLAARLKTHPQAGKRLSWLEQASDEYLEKIYDVSVALIAASAAEGFGLPLVEASQRGLPVIARDIPVFREVSGDYPTYFDGGDITSLTMALRQAALSPVSTESSKPHNALDWQTTTGVLWEMLFNQDHEQWLPAWTISRITD